MRGTLKRCMTRSGYEIDVDTSDEACLGLSSAYSHPHSSEPTPPLDSQSSSSTSSSAQTGAASTAAGASSSGRAGTIAATGAAATARATAGVASAAGGDGSGGVFRARSGSRVRTPRGNATVVGVADNKLWFEVDGESGAWFFRMGMGIRAATLLSRIFTPPSSPTGFQGIYLSLALRIAIPQAYSSGSQDIHRQTAGEI